MKNEIQNNKHYNAVGQFEYYPDLTGKRVIEGGRRISEKTRRNNRSKPLVSVITIVYNADASLERTIKSVQAQTYESIEHIIIDGGSTDSSLEIIKKYDKKLEYYISEPDEGLYHAMNKGIRVAKGDFICMLNADDYYKPEFIEESVKESLKSGADIVYSAIFWAGKERYPVEINSGILIHHLNINHMTFLATKETYNCIGLYNEDNKLFSDDEWTRSAFIADKKFIYLPKLMVVFSEGGLSEGNSAKKRQAILNESGMLMRKSFPFLSQEEAVNLIMSRFRIGSVNFLHKMYERYAKHEPLFLESFKNYLEFMLRYRESFIFQGENIEQLLPRYIYLAKKLNIPLDAFTIQLPNFDIESFMKNIQMISNKISEGKSKKILHFAAKFSSPSETFIYDLLIRMQANGNYQNIFLCDERILETERPYAYCISIPWDNLPKSVRELLYLHLFSKLQPDAIIAHFALNGWKLRQRILPLQIRLPIVNMTHGIDVFSISTKPEYREYILNYASLDPNTAFTTVSQYLFDALVSRGVPSQKIFFIPNVVHNRFFQYRKTSNFYDGSRDLRILNVGRLMGWKGHSELIDGIDYYVKNISENIHLTILYGNSGNDLNTLMEKIERLKLLEKVSLVEFINFNEVPDYYSDFDLFISSSKYSEGVGRRSETFGMSTLEAIAAGLPVIVTDAGGSPEVVGDEKIFSKIVPHADGKAIGKAIEAYVKENIAFSDNIEYAQKRLAVFSAEKQLRGIRDVLDKITAVKLKVAIFSSMNQGGAGKAAMRVHKALMMNDIESSLITRDNNSVIPQEPAYLYLAPEIGLEWESIQSRKNALPGYTMFSLNEPNLKRTTLDTLTRDMDVINIQWIARFLTAEDIGYLSNLGKPLLVTVRDMHPLTGGCHFFHDCDQWKSSCYGCPQLVDNEDHFPAKILAIKKHYWNMKNITFVALSQHTKNIIEQSSLYSDNRIEIIANPIDLDIFTPIDKVEAQKYFNIEKKTPLLFYVPSYGSLVKGSHEFKEALHYLKKKYPDFELTLIMAGSATALTEADDFLYPIIHLGIFSDNALLAKAYSTADATIVPSLEETFSNTAAESISCGTPVIGFKTGAIPEITGNGDRGISVTVGDIEALGEAIYSVLNHSDLAQNCRSYAEENFSFKKQGQKYASLFDELRKKPEIKNLLNPNEIPLIDPSVTSSLYQYQAKLLIANKKHLRKKDTQLKQKDTQLKKLNSTTNTLTNDKWHRFGKLSRKKKIWTVGKVLSKKMKIHWALKPFAQVVKKGIKNDKNQQFNTGSHL